MKPPIALIALFLIGCGASEVELQQRLAMAEAARVDASAAVEQAEAEYAAAVSERVSRMIEEESGVPRGELERLTAENVRLFAELDRETDAGAEKIEATIESNLKKHRLASERVEKAIERVDQRVATEGEAALFGDLPESVTLAKVRDGAEAAERTVEAIRSQLAK